MPDAVRVVLDILALLAVIFAIMKGIFNASADVTSLRVQVVSNTAWIEGHEKWSEKQTAEIQVIREDIAYIRGKLEHEERGRVL